MDVLIVGGNRFVGYDLAWRLLAGGHRLTLFNRGSRRDPFGPRVERLRGDRTTGDLSRLLAGRRFDAVVDFALFRGEEAADAVESLSGRVGHYVMISTGQVYLVREPRPSPAHEGDYEGPLMAAPVSAPEREEWDYGVGKRAAEDVLARAWPSSGFPSTRLRLPMVNGERDYHRRLEGYLWRILDGGPVILPDGGDRPTRHVYGAAVARAIAGLLGRRDTFGEAYNLAQDETPTAREMLAIAAELLGAPARFVPVPARDVEAAGLDVVAVSPFSGRWMSFLDPGRAKAVLGFRHEPLREYLGRIVAAFLAHPPASPPPALGQREHEKALAARFA
ncbi:MAG TPA: NAD-dependent epimerase/dehydratase family protein [Vicinamibacteria bacterium]